MKFCYASRPEGVSRADAVADLVPMARDQSGRIDRKQVEQLVALTAQVPAHGIVRGDRHGLPLGWGGPNPLAQAGAGEALEGG